MWPLSVSLQNLVQFGLPVLRAAAGAADAAADLSHGYDERNYQADEGQLPILADHHRQETKAANNCRSKSASMCEVATCTLSISFMIDDISWPVECDRKIARPASGPCRIPCSGGS